MKFSTIRKLLLKISLTFLLITFIVSLTGSSKSKEKADSLNIPKVADVRQEFIAQNTARYILENQLARSDVENNPSRYKILTAVENAANNMVGATIYDKDSKPYYGNISKASAESGFIVTPKTFDSANSRYINKSIYQKDQLPYYGSAESFKILSNAPKDRVAVPIELKELTYTYADEKNIRTLENNLKNLTGKESLNSISLSGKYMKDPTAYYDPTLDEKKAKAADIEQTIENMKNQIKNDIKLTGPVFTEENFHIKTKIQNIGNANKEDVNRFIAESYYYNSNVKPNTPLPHTFNEAEEAVPKKHDLVEVETTGESLGSKYYENKNKPNLQEAEEKDTSNVKNVEANAKITTTPAVKSLKSVKSPVNSKNEIPRKIEATAKIAKVEATATVAKVESKKFETVNFQENKPVEKILEKTVELKSDKRNLRLGPVFQGFKAQFAKVPQ